LPKTGILAFQGGPLGFELAPARFARLHLRLGRVAQRELPELPGRLHDRQGQAGVFVVGQAACPPLEAPSERGEPALQHGADGIGRAAADLLAHALDGGPQPLGQQLVSRGPHLGLLDTSRALEFHVPFAAAWWTCFSQEPTYSRNTSYMICIKNYSCILRRTRSGRLRPGVSVAPALRTLQVFSPGCAGPETRR